MGIRACFAELVRGPGQIPEALAPLIRNVMAFDAAITMGLTVSMSEVGVLEFAALGILHDERAFHSEEKERSRAMSASAPKSHF